MTSKKISHSAWSKYLLCPKMYDLHYNKRIRPAGTSSALLFGLAIDEALNALLLDKGKPLDVFRKNFPEFQDDTSIHPADIDLNVLDLDQKKELRGKDEIFQAWACLRVKGRLLLEAYEEVFFPQIEEVISVQKNLADRPGVIDAVIRHKRHGVVLIDHKTASKPYTKDALRRSTQLSLYAADQKIEKAGFVVLLKNLPKAKVCKTCGADGSGTRYKTCAEVTDGVRCRGAWDYTVDKKRAVQVLVADVPHGNGTLVQTSIREVEKAIRQGIYPRNLTSCNWVYGSPCPYIDYCWNGKTKGLVKKETK